LISIVFKLACSGTMTKCSRDPPSTMKIEVGSRDEAREAEEEEILTRVAGGDDSGRRCQYCRKGRALANEATRVRRRGTHVGRSVFDVVLIVQRMPEPLSFFSLGENVDRSTILQAWENAISER